MAQLQDYDFKRYENFDLEEDLQDKDTDFPNYVSDIYKFMASDWEFVSDIYNGTKWVKAKRNKYLLQEPAEDATDYEGRLQRSVLIPALKQTVNGLVGLMCRKTASIPSEMPEDLAKLLNDVDNNGSDINKFYQDISKLAWRDGVAYVLADYPTAEGVETLEDERIMGLRPYLVAIKASDLLSWRYEIVNGKVVTTQIVYRTKVEREMGLFGTKIVYQYHVRTMDMVQIWEMEFSTDGKNKDFKPTLVDEYPITFGFIPLEAYYINKKDDFIAEPPLLDLAEMNIKHYRVYSDYSHNLHVSSIPILAVYGDNESDDLKISVNTALRFSSEGSKMEYVETSGTSLNAARLELNDLENRMAKMGLQQLSGGAENKTATQSRIDMEEGRSTLQEAVINGEQVMNNSLNNIARIMGIELPEEAELVFSRDIDKMALDPAMIAQYSAMHANGQISLDTMWKMLAQGEILPDGFDAEAEKEKIEGESLGEPMGGSEEDLQPPDDELEEQAANEEMFIDRETGELITSSGNVIPLRREG